MKEKDRLLPGRRLAERTGEYRRMAKGGEERRIDRSASLARRAKGRTLSLSLSLSLSLYIFR